jgi:hypothetical protein
MKNKSKETVKPASGINTLLATVAAWMKLLKKPKSRRVRNFKPVTNQKYLSIVSQLSELESQVNKIVEQFEEQYKLENGSRGVRVLLKPKPETWKKTVEFRVGIDAKVLREPHRQI